MADLLYQKLKLAPGRKTTKKKDYSTAESELERLASESGSAIPRLVLDYRQASKLASTYTEALPTRVNPNTGRLHTRFIQSGAVTGRLASTQPNLQNIPIRSRDGMLIRSCFIAAPGNVLISADYSQIELRILAHLSGDQVLLDAFGAGEDVHLRTADQLFGPSLDSNQSELRRLAKTINYGLLYGMNAYGLAARLRISEAEAKDYIRRYFDRMPGVRLFLAELRKQASSRRFITTMFGR